MDENLFAERFPDSFRQKEGQSFSHLKGSKQGKPGEFEHISKLLAEVSSGLRILEDRYSNLRKKTQLTDQALLDAQRNFSKEERILTEELMDLKMKFQEIIEEVEAMRSELRDVVRQKDLKVIEKYLDMWDQMQFLTRKEAEKIISDRLGGK